jgi:hypothetical protein
MIEMKQAENCQNTIAQVNIGSNEHFLKISNEFFSKYTLSSIFANCIY